MLKLKQSSIKDNVRINNLILPILKYSMRRMRAKSHEIFRSIVIFNFIDMMTSFFRIKQSTNLFFYYKTMFKNITIFSTKWMLRRKNINISHLMFFNSAFPINIFFFIMNIFVRITQSFSMLFRKYSSFCYHAHFLFRFFRMMLSPHRMVMTFIHFTDFFFCRITMGSIIKRISITFIVFAHLVSCFLRMLKSFFSKGYFFFSFFRKWLSLAPRNMAFFELSAIHYRRL